RVLWQRSHPADDRHRIEMTTRCLVARGEGRVVLMDTGLGDDWSEKERDLYGIEAPPRALLSALEASGIAAEDVTDVILTHLHFDHVGGAVTGQDGPRIPTFRRARYHVQRAQLERALHPSEKDRRSFRSGTFEPLQRAGV